VLDLVLRLSSFERDTKVIPKLVKPDVAHFEDTADAGRTVQSRLQERGFSF